MINQNLLENLNRTNILNIIFLLIPISLAIGPLVAEISINLFSIIILYEILKNKEYKVFKEKVFIIFYIFYIAILISAVISHNFFFFIKAFFYIRLIIFLICAKYFFNKNLFKTKFLKIIFLFFVIVILDAIIQILTGVSLFGNHGQYYHQSSFNISGIFFEEEILGSYLSRLSPVIVFFILISLSKKNNTLLCFIFYFFCFLVVLFTGERVALFLMILNIFIFLLLLKNLKYYLISLIILSLTIFGSVKYNTKIYERLVNITSSQLFENNKLNWVSSTHTNHIIVSYLIFKDNKIFGAGPRSFRVECKKYKKIVNGCSTHPHNHPFQVLAETGLAGLSIFIIGLFYLYKFYLIKLYHTFRNSNIYDNLILLPLGSIVFQLLPVIPSGNLFNNWLSIMYFYIFSLIFYKKI